MKGIVLAGGSGTRLHPITKGISKQLLPVYDKPMIYYPISILMLAKIKDILIISTEFDIENYRKLLGDGEKFGVNFEYKVQSSPRGIADAFNVGEDFINQDKVCLILGDNIFWGQGLTDKLLSAKENDGATVFSYEVQDPERFGVIELDSANKVIGIEEKPAKPQSRLASTGLYFFDEKVTKYVKELSLSDRGELEICDLHKIYIENNALHNQLLGRGFAWIDTGTFESLLDASYFVKTIQARQGFKIACLEEIAKTNNWITRKQLSDIAKAHVDNKYGEYLLSILNEK